MKKLSKFAVVFLIIVITAIFNCTSVFAASDSEEQRSFNSITLSVGESANLDVDSSSILYTWSSNYIIAGVDSEGKVTAKRAGNCKIFITDNQRNVAVYNVKVQSTVISLAVGESYNINNNSMIRAWSNNSIVANIDSVGKITARQAGKCKIMVTDSQKNTFVYDIVVSNPKISLLTGESYTLSNNNHLIFYVRSSNKNVASVNYSGKIVAKNEGTTTITVFYSNWQTIKYDVVVSDIEINSITLSQTSLNMISGDTFELSASVDPAVDESKIVWTSSDSNIVTVDKGVLTAQSAGTATITASCGNVSAVCTVNVSERIVPATDVKLNTNIIVLAPNETYALKAVVSPSDSTDPVTWTSSNSDVVSVENGTIKAISAGTAVITAKAGTKTAVCNVKVEAPVSRLEWISALVEKLGLISESDDVVECSYSDIPDEYKNIIQTAVLNGILPQPENQSQALFRPNDPATREFAARTAVDGLRFEDDGSKLDCADNNELTYECQDAIAVDTGILSLIDGYFYPNRYITASVKNSVLEKVTAINTPPAIDNNHENKVIYADNVTVLTSDDVSYFCTVIENDTYTINALFSTGDADYAAGDILVLPENEDNFGGVTVKISSISKNADGSYTIKGTQPDADEIITFIDYQGSYDIKSMLFTPAEGVTVNNTSSNVYARRAARDRSLNIEVNGVGDSFSFAIDHEIFDNVKLNGNLEFKRPAIDFDVSFNSVYALLTMEQVFNGGISFSDEVSNTDIASRTFKDEIRIGNFKVPLGTGVTLKFDVKLVIEITGEVKIEITLNEKFGVQTVNGHPRSICSITPSASLPKLEASAKVGPKLSVFLRGIGVDIIDLSIEAGACAKGSITPRPTGMVCLDARLFLYTELSTGEEEHTIASKLFKVKKVWKIFTEDNSPLKKTYHFEDFVRVSECTFGFGTLSGYVQSADNSNGISGAVVTVYSGDNELVKSVTTDENGRFMISSIGTGTYQVEVSANGYNTEAKSGVVAKDSITTLRFTLTNEPVTEKGELSGYVAKASDRTSYIPDAKIEIYNGSSLKETLTSNASGNYIANLPVGDYSLHISADGYIPFDCNVTVTANTTSYVETLLMVDDGGEGAVGRTSGKIIDAVTGGIIADVKINVRIGWNKKTGDIVYTTTSDANGNYTLPAALGNYTLEAVKEGYVTEYINTYVQLSDTSNQNITMNPTESSEIGDNIRIVLTWGATPSDLDSHLLGPTTDGNGRFHIFYSNKTYGSVTDLDIDDVSSYGPETVTIRSLNDTGIYSYYVHDYSNRNSSGSKAMSNSGAQVKVFSGNSLIATYNVPTNTVGTVWHVFDYDAEANTISVANTMSNISAPGNVGSRAYSMRTLSDIDIIAKDLTDEK